MPGIPGSPGEPILKADAAGVIGDQRTSAVAKDKCAHDWRDFYQSLRNRIGGFSADGKPASEESK